MNDLRECLLYIINKKHFFRDFRFPNWATLTAYISFGLLAVCYLLKWRLGDASTLSNFWLFSMELGIVLSLMYLQSFLIYRMNNIYFNPWDPLFYMHGNVFYELSNSKIEMELRLREIITDNIDDSLERIKNYIDEFQSQADKCRRENEFSSFPSKIMWVMMLFLFSDNWLSFSFSKTDLPFFLIKFSVLVLAYFLIQLLKIFRNRKASMNEMLIGHLREIKSRLLHKKG